MSTTILALQDLSCTHCVKNVTQILNKLDGIEETVVTLDFAKVKGDIDPNTVIQAIVEVGYQAKLAHPAFSLALNGLNCEHCIRSTEKVLNALQGAANNSGVFKVSKTQADFYGNWDVQSTIDAIVGAGFEASLLVSDSK